MLKAIPRSFVDLTTLEILTIMSQLLNTRKAVANDYVPEFEKAFAQYIGTKEAVAFPYCRTGMFYALKALDLDQDDEVILPAFTFWVDAAMVVLAGLKPVFVDVKIKTASIDPAKIEGAITPRTKVIFPTHLNGLPSDMDPIMNIARKYDLRVLEDCARSCGATYKNNRIGSFDIGAFSFGYGKSFYCVGGSMVTSNDEAFIGRLRELKQNFNFMSVKKLYFENLKGCLLRYLNLPYLHKFSLFPLIYQFQVNGKEKYAKRFRVRMQPYDRVPEEFMVDMNNIQSKLGLKQLARIDKTNKKRIDNARILTQELSGLPDLLLPPKLDDREHVYVHYAIWNENNKDLQKFLTLNNIDAQDETAVDTTMLDRFKPFVIEKFPNAKKLNGKLIFLPTHPNLKKSDMVYIADKVKEFLKYNK